MGNRSETPKWRRVVAAGAALTALTGCRVTFRDENQKADVEYSSPFTTQAHPSEAAPRTTTTADTRPATSTTTATTVYVRPAPVDTRPQPTTTSPFYRQMTADELWRSCRPIAGSAGTCDRGRFEDLPEGDSTIAHMRTGQPVELVINRPGQNIEVWDCFHFEGKFPTPIDANNTCEVTVRSAAKTRP